MISSIRTLLGLISSIRHYRGISLPDICKRARKLTLVGIAGCILLVIEDQLMKANLSSGNNWDNLLLLPVMIAGLMMVIASFLFKIIMLFSNLDKKIELVKIYIVEFFVALFLGTIAIFDKLGYSSDLVLYIGLAAYYSIALIYYLYCERVYKEKK